jgi:hypothetical protein
LRGLDRFERGIRTTSVSFGPGAERDERARTKGWGIDGRSRNCRRTGRETDQSHPVRVAE